MSESVLPMFSSRGFIIYGLTFIFVPISYYLDYCRFVVSGLTFRSLIHFEFIFVYGVRKCSTKKLC